MEQKYIKASEVAEMFGVTRQTIRNWIDKGLLIATKLDNSHYVTMQSVKAIEDKFKDIVVTEDLIERYKESLDVTAKEYLATKELLRSCCNENLALRQNKEYVVKFLPILFPIVKVCGEPSTRRGEAMMEMLLRGQDVKAISERFSVTPERVKQIIDKEQRIISCEATLYSKLKSENETLKKQLEVMGCNLKSMENIGVELKEVEVEDNILTKKLSDCNLSVRTLNCLRSYQEFQDGNLVWCPIETVGDLARRNKTDLLKLRNFGKKCLTEIDDFLDELGLEWGTNYIVREDGTVVEANPKQ